ncbi:MAG: DUF2029 domain-containing protein [Roseiflexus sp.]|nr:DUF2029 domain-containing protein [Roseiflexus sp.]MCS7288910.1 DUF2029 domain-containing protein [Roseiflexus sp.]MDW8146146.1 glycosyltransferase family 87 protein [Roseiflexaceae bacterium]MDW8234257.1 glycosyltransferase family 87 protein [Roseiflexaceae bacterium]
MSVVQSFRSEPLLHTALRLMIGGCVLLCGMLLAQRLPNPDLFGDYAAACAWWQRFSEHSWIVVLSQCSSDIDYRAFGPHAHPPFSTIVFLFLGFFSWPDARWVWFVISGACLIGAWHYYRVPVSVCAATALFGVFGLYRGTMEPFLFTLMMIALSQEDKRPILSAALIGLAAAIKVYPGLLLAALLIARRFEALLAGIAIGGFATVISELALGFGTVQAWIFHTPSNALTWQTNPDNLSLVRIAGHVAPHLSPLVTALALLALAIALLIAVPHRKAAMRMILPTALLVTPLVWSHYVIHAGMLRLTRLEQALLLAGSGLIFLGILGVFPVQNAAVAYGPVLTALALLWYRTWRSGVDLSTQATPSGAAHDEPALPNSL